ncbi:MAG: hypothetical protein AUG09_06220 [Acidobacteria bacterium 13_1_20CM_2_68_7]|nr:MAG: hypothetical protein AUG09_06220 [Acidobacteria bacterium 13_1_20CM_2_68_7]
MLSRMTVEQFAEALAAATPTPGGGSASAQAGAMAASLIQTGTGPRVSGRTCWPWWTGTRRPTTRW